MKPSNQTGGGQKKNVKHNSTSISRKIIKIRKVNKDNPTVFFMFIKISHNSHFF